MKVCKVITTVFLGRVIREETALCGDPEGLFNHSQNFPTPESVVDLIKLIVSLEKKNDPGLSTDVVIVNNDVDYEDGNDYLRSLEGVKIHSGKIKILFRKNIGRSFGGYNHAFKKFRKKYDYFIFTEDDILVNYDGYAKKAVELFDKHENVGAVAYQSTSLQNLEGESGDEFLHIHGGVCLSSTKVLNELYEKLGNLPYSSVDEDYMEIIRKGEIPFSNEIHKMGYDLINMEEKVYEYAYDYMRDIKL